MITSRLDAYISRYDDFCANNDNDDDTTDYFTRCIYMYMYMYIIHVLPAFVCSKRAPVDELYLHTVQGCMHT